MPEDHPLSLRRASPPHDMPHEGPRAAPSCDGCAAPLALPGSGEHGPDVLSTPSAQLQAESSDRAVVTREKRWLGERVDWAVRRARREPLRGVRERPPVLATAAVRPNPLSHQAIVSLASRRLCPSFPPEAVQRAWTTHQDRALLSRREQGKPRSRRRTVPREGPLGHVVRRRGTSE